ncbi:hypothetical protein CRENBAI_011263 [Crenichthys baileyi]|uniref:Uncharacterized protein n=1 Tax=Crenichthys baileyi TaxID=28760 RepID=A0AAV9SFN0_9TELE
MFPQPRSPHGEAEADAFGSLVERSDGGNVLKNWRRSAPRPGGSAVSIAAGADGAGGGSAPFSACSPGCALWSGSEALALLPPQEKSARSTFLWFGWRGGGFPASRREGCDKTVSQARCSSAHAVFTRSSSVF